MQPWHWCYNIFAADFYYQNQNVSQTLDSMFTEINHNNTKVWFKHNTNEHK